MLSIEETRLKLNDLRQAVSIEKSHRYTDVQGRHKTFSRFVWETLGHLKPILQALLPASSVSLNKTAIHSKTLKKGEQTKPVFEEQMDLLRRQFEQYPHLDVGRRMNAVESLVQFLETLFTPSDFQIVNPPTLPSPTKGEEDLNSSKREIQFEASISHSSMDNPSSTMIESVYPPPFTGQQGRVGGKDSLLREVQFLKGVGPRLAQLLGLVNIQTVEELLYYFPRRYLDYNNRAKIMNLEAGQDVTVIGTIHTVNAYTAKQIAIVSVLIQDETGIMSANWFLGKATSRATLEAYKSRYPKGADILLSGKVKWDTYKRIPAMDRPQLEILSYQDASSTQETDSLHAGRIVPIYPLTEGLNLRFLRKAIHQALQETLDQIDDPIPNSLLKRYQLQDLRNALQQIHFPDSMASATEARERLVFDELFYVQLRLNLIRQQYKRTVQGLSLQRKTDGYYAQLQKMLPFQLTQAQQRVLSEITDDIASPEPMYRLLQGDVGSGKTVVAVLTLLIAVENGYQGALMAPTEILAEQHYRKCIEWLTPLGLKVGLFVGKTGMRQRRELRQSLLNGQIHIAIGTHALIQEDVEFANLGMVVVDEQHRFGVRQRTLLKSKGQHPEMLTMTATPIPRSLAMTLHGDLDVSLLDERPPGRSPIRTNLLTHGRIGQAYQLIRQEVLKGHQAYVVFPLIEESETLSAKAATTEAERLQQEVFPDLIIGLLHGKMRPEEKDAMMQRFSNGELHILVSTTVVEVGVDVPNATVMVIENADRFGLSQLHQLRGRVGRASHQSYCVLVSDSRTEETLTRLSILTESEDGFYIAEKDLAIRGPGEFLGTRQSGLPDFVLADLIQDKAILEKAREAATKLVHESEGLSDYPALLRKVYQKTQDAFSVLGAG